MMYPSMKRFAIWRATTLYSIFLVIQVGCKPEQLEQLTETVRQATVDQVVQPSAPAAGSFDLKLDLPLQTSEGFAKWLPIGDGRPNVLRIRSYEDSSKETFPSVLIQAQTTVADVKGLVGTTLKATIYAATSAYSPIWYLEENKQADLLIKAVDDKSITCEIVSAPLVSTEGKTTNATGTVRAIFGAKPANVSLNDDNKAEQNLASKHFPDRNVLQPLLGVDRVMQSVGGQQ